jgi:hypothetical protein
VRRAPLLGLLAGSGTPWRGPRSGVGPWLWTAAAAGTALLAGCTSVVAGTAAPAPLTLRGTEVAAYPAGQLHTASHVDYLETPPVGGQHDPEWADCTGSVYAVEIRPENAVHSLEHGAVWVTYDPALTSPDDVVTLTQLVDGRPGLMLSPYPDQGAVISLQAWNHQVQVSSAGDPRVVGFLDLLVFNPDTTPEPGATCENPGFLDATGRPA